MMTFICAGCQSPIELLPFNTVRCQCGARYAWVTTMSTSTSAFTAFPWQGEYGEISTPGYSAREQVPQAFHDAFKGEELTP